MYNSKIAALLCLLLVASSIRAQESTLRASTSAYEVELFSLNFQKPHGTLRDFVEDSRGFIWMVGSKGLHVFDGYQTLTYSPTSKKFPLGTNGTVAGIQKMSIDQNDIIYLRTNDEIIAFDALARVLKFNIPKKHVKEDLSHHLTFEDDKSRIKLFEINPNKSATIEQIENGKIRHLAEFSMEGKFPEKTWQLSSLGSFSKGSKHQIATTTFIFEFNEINNEFDFYTLDKTNGYLFVPGQEHLYFIDQNQDSFSTFNIENQTTTKIFDLPLVMQNNCVELTIDQDGTYYTGTYVVNLKKGIYQDLSSKMHELILKKSSGSIADEIVKLKTLKDGSVMLLTERNLFRIKPASPNNSQYQELIKDLEVQPSMRGLTEDKEGNIYVTYYNAGLAVKKLGQKYFRAIDLNDDRIFQLRNVFHLNTWGNYLIWGETKIDLTNMEITPLNSIIQNSHTVHHLYKDTLWHFNWYNDQIYKTDLSTNKTDAYTLDFPITGRDRFEIVNAIEAVPGSSDKYFVQNWYGISRISNKGKEQKALYTTKVVDTDNFAVHDLIVKDHILWIADKNGLVKYDTRNDSSVLKVSNYVDQNNRVQKRTMYLILEDEQGNFYLGSNRGLLYYNVADDLFLELPDKHPLSTLEFNRASKFRDKSGRYYFGTTNGLFSFLPDELSFNDPAPDINTIKLVSISYFDLKAKEYKHLSQRLNEVEVIHLKPNENNLSLLFSNLELSDDLLYSYRLSDAGNEWSSLNVKPEIFFNYLSPGEHILQMRVSKRAGNLTSSIKEYKIQVDQIWYKRWYFIPLLVLGISGFVLLYFRYSYQQKIKQQERINLLRNNISNDLHDDVGSILTGMAMQSEVIAHGKKGKDKEALSDIALMSRQATERMRDIVWAMDSSKDKYQNLIDRMHEVAIATLKPLGIRYTFLNEELNLSNFIAPNKRKELHLIFKEALTNIIKHSNADQVEVSFQKIKDRITFTIADNGTNISTNIGDGLGISSMKKRAENINGQLITDQSQGFKIIIHFDVDV